MRKHLNLWNVFIAVIVVLTAAWIVPRSQNTNLHNTGPPNDAVSVQADNMGLSYFDSTTVRVNTVAIDDPAIAEPACSTNLPAPERMIALASARIAGTYATESEVSAPTRGTRPDVTVALLKSTTSEASRWGGMLRMVSDTGSRSVPVT